MAKQLFNAIIHTGTQVFSDEAEYTSFLNGLNTSGSPMEQMEQYVQSLISAGDIVKQKHHKTLTGSVSTFTTSKIFASEDAASSYLEWLGQGEGKSLALQWMQPLGWTFVSIFCRPLGDEEYAAIAATAD